MPDTIAQNKFYCPTCGAELIQKNQVLLIVVGLCMIALVAGAFVFRFFWIPAIVPGATGAYLLVWATIGKGRWCRNCKNFGIGR